MVDITDYILETNRLILKKWTFEDLEYLYDYASEEGVGEMAGWTTHRTLEDSERVLNHFIEKSNVYAIVLKDTKTVIGSVGIHESWTDKDPRFCELRIEEIGYVLSKKYWGKGLMTEAVSKVIDSCFKIWELDAVACSHFDGNNQSKRVIEKNGFRYMKTDEKYVDLLAQVMISHHYLKMNQSE